MEYHESGVIGLGEGDEGGRARGRVRVHPKQRRATRIPGAEGQRPWGRGAAGRILRALGPQEIQRHCARGTALSSALVCGFYAL